jgi:IS1 family transposase/transposase-like protein
MSEERPVCPRCGSHHTVKNGKIHHKKPKHKCQDCGRQFVKNPTKKYILPSVSEYIDKMLLEKIPLAGILRVTGVSKTWLQNYVNNLYSQVTGQLEVTFKHPKKLTIECDEAWSFVNSKAQKQWKELALDVETKEIIGVYIGARNKASALKLWHSLPPYRQCAVCYPDFWDCYQVVFPRKRHKAVGKDSGKTNHIERFNKTMRQRISRLVRQTLSFSKKLENHIGAIWYFIHYYNASLRN